MVLTGNSRDDILLAEEKAKIGETKLLNILYIMYTVMTLTENVNDSERKNIFFEILSIICLPNFF